MSTRDWGQFASVLIMQSCTNGSKLHGLLQRGRLPNGQGSICRGDGVAALDQAVGTFVIASSIVAKVWKMELSLVISIRLRM
jgi:hypothetical protein